MKTLWAYGCSWTYSDIHEIYLGFKFWPELLYKDLNCENFINRGCGGYSVAQATIRLIEDLGEIQKDDIVIFQFTYPERLSMIDLYTDERKGQYWYSFEIPRNPPQSPFFKEKRMLPCMEFLLSFREELLIQQFMGLKPIFDYIENVIGAKVKYWYINVSGTKNDRDMLQMVENMIWDEKRMVTFPSSKYTHHCFTHYMEAGTMLVYEKMRICDRIDDYDWKNIEFLKNKEDGHPTQKGQETIARCILSSFS